MRQFSETRSAFGQCPVCDDSRHRYVPCRYCGGTRRYLMYGCGDPYWTDCPNCNVSGGVDICGHGIWRWHVAPPQPPRAAESDDAEGGRAGGPL